MEPRQEGVGSRISHCSICLGHTPLGLTVASQRKCTPAATLTTRDNTAQQRRDRRLGSLKRQIERVAAMRRPIEQSHARRTPCKKTQSHGTASACHNAVKTTVAIQAPINPIYRRSCRALLITKIVHAQAAMKEVSSKGRNGFIVGCEIAESGSVPAIEGERRFYAPHLGSPACRAAANGTSVDAQPMRRRSWP